MNPHNLEDNLLSILELARLSPSVHNTQPWKVRADGDTLLIKLDAMHTLKDGDPTGRETIISLGIFCQAVIMAAESLGFSLKDVDFQHDSAAISFGTKSKEPTQVDKKNIELLQKRCSDRSIYTPCEVSNKDANSIKSVSTDKGVNIWVVTDRNNIETTAQLTSQGIDMALSNPKFREELSDYIVPLWSNKSRGIAVGSLYLPLVVELVEPIFIRLGLRLGSEAQLEKQRWLSSSAVVFITSDGDMPDDWFNSGMQYLNVSLKLEDLGFSQATSAAAVEASNFHEDIETMLGTKQRLQSVLRIGKGSLKRVHSPRLSAAELLAT